VLLMAETPKSGIVLDSRVLAVSAGALSITAAILAVFMWMVPSAAAREEKAACRGLHGYDPLNAALCTGGNCALPTPAPDFAAMDHDGKPVKLSDFRGKVVLVNFCLVVRRLQDRETIAEQDGGEPRER